MALLDNIQDDALRAEVLKLNLTLPDPNSVLDPGLETSYPQLYYKLVCMEAYTYQNSQQADGQQTPTYVEYAPFWQTYNAVVMGYVNAPPLSKQTIKDFLIGFFCFMSVHVGRGVGPASLIQDSDAKRIFNFGGYYESTVQAWPLNYFDDLIVADPAAMPEPTETVAPRLTDAPVLVAPLYGADSAQVSGLIGQYADIVSDVGVMTVFSNPTAPQGALSPTEIWDLVFDELNWGWYIDTFGSDVVVPPRP